MDKSRPVARPHALVVALCGRGKGTGALIPDLGAYEGKIEVCDPQGESFTIPARWKKGPSHG